MRDERQAAIAEARDLFTNQASITGAETFSRDEATDALGKSWSNICDITVDPAESVRRLKLGIEVLKRHDFVVGVEYDDAIVVHVSTSYEVSQRHADGENA